MRVFHILPGSVSESSTLPMVLPEKGYLWIACGRREFEVEQGAVQSTLQVLCGMTLVDLHISDLLNNQLPSHYDYTSQYDILVFRRLAAGHTEHDVEHPGTVQTGPVRRGGPPVLRRIDTSPVGFAVFDRVLLTVHPAGCLVLDHYASRLLAASTAASRAAGVHLPPNPADLMDSLARMETFYAAVRAAGHELLTASRRVGDAAVDLTAPGIAAALAPAAARTSSGTVNVFK